MISKLRIPSMFILLAILLALSASQFGDPVGASSQAIPVDELGIEMDLNITINITDPTDDIVIHKPGALNNTTTVLNELKGNLTNTSLPGGADSRIVFDGSRNVDDIVIGNRTGITAAPGLLKTGTGLIAKKALGIIPSGKSSGGSGGSAASALIANSIGKLTTMFQGAGNDDTSIPEVSSEEFIATTLMGALIMAFATVFSTTRKYPFFLLPLYSRISRDHVLENPTRESIYRLVATHPGMDLLSIKTSLELENGVLAHHIHTLERERYLRSVRDGRYRRFYVQGTEIGQGRSVEALILIEIEKNPMISQSDLARSLNISRQAVNYHIRKLTDKGMIITEKKGRVTLCRRRDF